MKKNSLFAAIAISVLALCSCNRSQEYDVCVYGGTSAAVMAAYSAAQSGQRVVMVSPDLQIGGMSSGGLGYTDIGNKYAVVGLARQFYRRIGQHYGRLEQWIFEPHVARDIFEEYLAAAPGLKVMRTYRLDSIEKEGTDITSIRVFGKDGDTLNICAKSFVDATYEGDLMAMAGVSYIVGREGNDVYGETYDGVQLMTGHQFPDGIDPFVEPGNPESGLIWGVSNQKLLPDGTGDNLVQAYNYRICLTDDPANRIEITRPENYDSTRYELTLRLYDYYKDTDFSRYFIWSYMPNHKTDINNKGGFSTDMIGMNYGWAEASWAEREEIQKAHTDYTKGMLYFFGHDQRLPESVRTGMQRWGYPKDEYTELGNWTPQLYVREARRMIGEYVATQADCEGRSVPEDGIAMAAYTMDSHNCQRIVVEKDGKFMVKNEGNVEIGGGSPYPVSYRSITPKRQECTNLLVPVCLSASHIAYGSIRMEPVFMATGQAAGIAAALASKRKVAVQQIPASDISTTMKENPAMDGSEPDLLIDDTDEEYLNMPAGWERVRTGGGYGPTFCVNRTGTEPISFNLPERLNGQYEVYTYMQSRQDQTPVTRIIVNDGSEEKQIDFVLADQTVQGQTSGEWFHLGTFTFNGKPGASVRVMPDGKTFADALLIIKK